MSIVVEKIKIHGVTVSVVRDDLNHPVVQGNKLRKLKFHLIEARIQGAKTIVTFGGAYSNHLVATAYAARDAGFLSVGVVRGDELAGRPDLRSHTLKDAASYGMSFLFVNRSDYRLKTEAEPVQTLLANTPDYYLVSEGGSGQLAVKGVAELMGEIAQQGYQPSHVFCPVGTGGTVAGIICGAQQQNLKCQVFGTVVLKGLHCVNSDIEQWLGCNGLKVGWNLLTNYHFGGYAKWTEELRNFALKFGDKHGIPLDKIYNSKSFFALNDMIEKGEISPQDQPMIIHTGGLQGGTFGAIHNEQSN